MRRDQQTAQVVASADLWRGTRARPTSVPAWCGGVVLVRHRHYFFCALRAHMGEFWHGIISWHYIMMFRPSSISYHMIFDMTMI